LLNALNNTINTMSKKKIGIYVTALIIVILILAVLANRNSSTNNEVKVKKGNIDLIVAAKGRLNQLRMLTLLLRPLED